MAEVAKEIVEDLERQHSGMQMRAIGNGVVWKGPWLDKWFDNYTEALYANINFKRNEEYKKQGLNQHAQTKEQEAALKAKKAEAEKSKTVREWPLP